MICLKRILVFLLACSQTRGQCTHLPQPFSILFGEAGSLTEPGMHHFFLLHWLASLPQEAFCLHFSSLAVEVCAVDVCVACALSPEPLSLPQILKSTLLILYSGNWTAGCTSSNRVLTAVVHAGSELFVQN